jgi:hypothetical protein
VTIVALYVIGVLLSFVGIPCAVVRVLMMAERDPDGCPCGTVNRLLTEPTTSSTHCSTQRAGEEMGMDTDMDEIRMIRGS